MLANAVAGAPEALLERNAFYAGLKRLAVEQATAIEALKSSIASKDQDIQSRDEEIRLLKERCDTQEYVCSACIHICSILLNTFTQEDHRQICTRLPLHEELGRWKAPFNLVLGCQTVATPTKQGRLPRRYHMEKERLYPRQCKIR